MNEKILVWAWFIGEILNVAVCLHEVSKGEHYKKELPITNAIAAVIHMLLACLIWIYLIPLV